MIVSFIGNSDSFGADVAEEKEKLMRALYDNVGDKECLFYLGGYGWFDNFAKNCCREYADTHKNCKIILVIPYLNRKYDTDGYDETLYPPLEKVPYRLCIVRRNEWMIDNADLVISYIKYIGFARNFLFYAEKKKKNIIRLADING